MTSASLPKLLLVPAIPGICISALFATQSDGDNSTLRIAPTPEPLASTSSQLQEPTGGSELEQRREPSPPATEQPASAAPTELATALASKAELFAQEAGTSIFCDVDDYLDQPFLNPAGKEVSAETRAKLKRIIEDGLEAKHVLALERHALIENLAHENLRAGRPVWQTADDHQRGHKMMDVSTGFEGRKYTFQVHAGDSIEIDHQMQVKFDLVRSTNKQIAEVILTALQP